MTHDVNSAGLCSHVSCEACGECSGVILGPRIMAADVSLLAKKAFPNVAATRFSDAWPHDEADMIRLSPRGLVA